MTATTATSDQTGAQNERNVALVTIITPFVAFIIAAVVLLSTRSIGSMELGLFMEMYAITMAGITIGFHRLFTHRSFKCSWAIKALLCIAGCMAAQGPVIFWVACHRRHHQHSDASDDPHSPHFAGGGFRGLLWGWWHSHMGWMFYHKPENYFRLTPDLLRDKLIMRLNSMYLLWVLLGLLIPGLFEWAIKGTLTGFLMGMLWGGLVRIFIVHHVTWSINSVCHMFGAQAYDTGDESKNNAVCAILTFGEGWHNNHHAFPTSARHGLKWWQLDVAYWMICSLRAMGLAWDLRIPAVDAIERNTYRVHTR